MMFFNKLRDNLGEEYIYADTDSIYVSQLKSAFAGGFTHVAPLKLCQTGASHKDSKSLYEDVLNSSYYSRTSHDEFDNNK